MTKFSIVERLWKNRHHLLPGASEDEIQEAFTAVMTSPPDAGDWAEALREAGLSHRRRRADTLAREMSWDATNLHEYLDRWYVDDEAQPLPSYQAPTIEAAQLAEILDRSLREAGETTRQAFILTELRGVPAGEAAEILGIGYLNLESLVAGFKGLLKARLTR